MQSVTEEYARIGWMKVNNEFRRCERFCGLIELIAVGRGPEKPETTRNRSCTGLDSNRVHPE